jgi:hypothetical protein
VTRCGGDVVIVGATAPLGSEGAPGALLLSDAGRFPAVGALLVGVTGPRDETKVAGRTGGAAMGFPGIAADMVGRTLG